MNGRIASILKDRISQFTWVDKLAGLVRRIEYQRAGTTIAIPVADDVEDALACDPSTLREMVPDDQYRCIVYFEHLGGTTEKRHGRTVKVSHLRLVCWINTTKLNGDSTAGDRIMQEFEGALAGPLYNSGAFLGIRHKVEGHPAKGPSLFSAYTYPEGVRQYLMWPFDAFALDIATEYRMNPNCIVPIDPTDVDCWTPPTTRRRRDPKDFTCEELLDPVTGLTEAQLIDCLNCSGVIPPDMPYIIASYTSEAIALADTTTVPLDTQAIKITDSGRLYQGDGVSSSADLIAAKRFTPGFTEGAATGVRTTFEGATVNVQIF